MLSLRCEPPRAVPYLSIHAHCGQYRHGDQQSGGRGTLAAVGVTRSAEPLSALAERPIAPGAHAASWRRGEFYPGRCGGGAASFERVGDRTECRFTVDVPL